MADDGNRREEATASGRSGPSLRLIALAVLVAITAALALDNRHDVTIGWVVGDSTAPLALALAVVFLLGLAVGWIGARHRAR